MSWIFCWRYANRRPSKSQVRLHEDAQNAGNVEWPVGSGTPDQPDSAVTFKPAEEPRKLWGRAVVSVRRPVKGIRAADREHDMRIDGDPDAI